MRITAYVGYCVVMAGGGTFYAMLLAHLRIRLTTNKTASFLEAWHSLRTSPTAFLSDTEASLLFVLTLILFALTSWKAPAMYDYLWGCSAANRQAEADRAEVDAEADAYRDEDLPEIQKEAIDQIDDDLVRNRKVFDAAIRICGRAVADDDFARARKRQSQDAFVAFRTRLGAELQQIGAPPLAAGVPAITIGQAGAQEPTPLDPRQALIDLQQQRADLVDHAEHAKEDMRAALAGEINALPDLLADIAGKVRDDITAAPARHRS
jgi:hypothetical protein